MTGLMGAFLKMHFKLVGEGKGGDLAFCDLFWIGFALNQTFAKGANGGHSRKREPLLAGSIFILAARQHPFPFCIFVVLVFVFCSYLICICIDFVFVQKTWDPSSSSGRGPVFSNFRLRPVAPICICIRTNCCQSICLKVAAIDVLRNGFTLIIQKRRHPSPIDKKVEQHETQNTPIWATHALLSSEIFNSKQNRTQCSTDEECKIWWCNERKIDENVQFSY